ncbi:hypothetical protein [Bacillus massiliigorillae]|uniref:hypothetical protein n=1 Tax=Bacillus massiliigorillae TaxID=1243664 RepID=UPI00039AB34A|nr:hypothetical protein [Bacillus massiliigorillae]
MPKIHRIRIVGLKYDGMQKQYQDTTFDFHNEITSTNGLIAMMNGGGKGVFLQTIFQVLKPGTSWGKQNNRYYQQFFFNKKEQFIPYTFHVLIEWELDGADHRHLVTGGMFSAEQRFSMNDEGQSESATTESEAKITPNITFYAREFERKEDVALEHIPLYEDGEVADSEELKDYFKWNGYDVYRDIKKHYRILDTYGINRKDWDIMKDINKDEGGVGKYFEGAEDDHSLFQKRIIPTVSQVLHRAEHQKNDLVDIFKSQASIAKDLPILLKREQAHKEFLEDIVPFEHQIAVSVEHEEIVQSSTKEGQQLLGALDHIIELEKESLVALEQEIEKLQKRSTELRFEKDNLEYAKAYRDIQKWEKQLALEKEKHQSIQEKVTEKNEKKEQLAFALLKKEWAEIEQTIASLSQQMDKLEQNSGLEQVNQRMEEIKSEAKKQWDEAYEAIKSENKQYRSYQLYIDKKAKELAIQDKQKTKEIAQLDSEIDSLYSQIHTFENKEAKLVKQFGDRLTYDLKGLMESIKEKSEKYLQEIDSLKKDEKTSREQQYTLSLKLGELRQALQHMNEKCQQLTETYNKQQEKEETLLAKLRGLLDDAVGPFTQSLLSKYATGVEELLKQNREQSEHLKQELWEMQLDQSLNDESYWIANQDIKELKESIDEKTGIDVFYGSQFLQSLTDEERLQYLDMYPLLPFSLIVSKHQWEKINQQVLTSRMFKSPVPIYMREEMSGGTDHSFVVVNGSERGLLTSKTAFLNWKASSLEQMEEKKETLFEIEKTEVSLRRILKEIDRLAASELCSEINQALQNEEAAISKTKAELYTIEKEEEKEKDKQAQFKERIEQAEMTIEKSSKETEILTAFEEEKSNHQENKRVKEEKEKKKIQFLTQQSEVEKEHQHMLQLQKEWNQTYLEWKLSLEQDIKDITRFVDEAAFPPNEKAEISEDVPQLSPHILDEIKGSITELNQLQKSKEEQAQELLALQATVKVEQKQQGKIEKKLRSFNEEWKDVAVAEEPIRILEEMHQAAHKEAKEAEKEERAQGTAVTVADTSLNHAKVQCEKTEKKVAKHEKQPEPWEDADLDVKETEIKDQTKLTKDALKKAEKKQKETEANITGYEGDKLTLSVILKQEASTFTATHLEQIQKQGKTCILNWCDSHQNVQEEKQAKHLKLEQSLRKLKLTIEAKDWELRFKNEVLTSLDHMDTRHYEHIQTIVQNMKRFSYSGLEQLDRDKERAEKAQDFWASRASMKVMSIADSIRSMIAKMKIKNERGAFPLVQLKEDILPKKAEEVEPLLKQHFVSAIDKITRQYETIDNNNKSLEQEIKQLIGDEQILFVSLRNRYPELLVYNMRTDNAFMYGKPQKEHYSTWQTINQGSRTKSDGSGGQKLSARMVMMMMLLSVKSENDTNWVPLVCDNPFGQAASAHVLDPIFAVADKLKFQLIVVTPPELVKTEISQRFDAYYKLDFIREKGKEIVTDTVVPAYRIYQGEEVLNSI